MTFSAKNRADNLRQMASRPLDLLIIGGGITGAGIALDAAVRGLNTGIVDMQDFAGGTSSRSTKLVHGGLRYLKQFEVKLVAEVGQERSIVYENAPHVTRPEWMLMPIYQGGTFGRFSTSIGLKIYDMLAKVKYDERRRMLNKKQTLEKEPLLNEKGLQGSGYYVEYRTDDARLTIEVIKEAACRGAKAVNYAKAVDLIYDAERRLTGVKVEDRLTACDYTIYAKEIVNAAGPWADTIREMDHSKKSKYLHLTKGVHIVIDGKRFPMKQAVYFDAANDPKRMIFAIPRDGKVYVGTTDTTYDKLPIKPRVTADDQNYLLDAINGMFPNVYLKASDIESGWAGVRPLIHEEGKSPSEISRKDEIFLSESGLITIAGGKLTGYRKMAGRVVDLAANRLKQTTGISYPPCQTDHVELSGGHFGGSKYFAGYVEEKTAEGRSLGLTETEARFLVNKYGTNAGQLFDVIRTRRDEADACQLPPEIFATIAYAIEEEMAVSPVDYFTRRTGSTLFNIEWVKKWQKPILNYMAERLLWTDEEIEHYRAEMDAEIDEATRPADED